MARITVEDCLEKVDNQYDLVLLAKERTVQLNAGAPMLVEEDNDKRTIISLREIGDGKIDVNLVIDFENLLDGLQNCISARTIPLVGVIRQDIPVFFTNSASAILNNFWHALNAFSSLYSHMNPNLKVPFLFQI